MPGSYCTILPDSTRLPESNKLPDNTLLQHSTRLIIVVYSRLLAYASAVVFLKHVTHIDVLELSACCPVDLADEALVVLSAVARALQVSWAHVRYS